MTAQELADELSDLIARQPHVGSIRVVTWAERIDDDGHEFSHRADIDKLRVEAGSPGLALVMELAS